MRLMAMISGLGAALLAPMPCSAQTLTKIADLEFGKIVPLSSSAEVTISPSGNRSPQEMLVSGGGQHAASFKVSGTPNADVVVTFGSPTSLSGPGTAMGLSGFTTSLGSANEGKLDPSTGQLTFTVGATLTVGAPQTAGLYKDGAIPVTVTYKVP